MFYKKTITILLSVLIILSNLTFTKTIVKAEGDSTAPQITNISIDKKEATMGENIKITADISDDISGVKYVTIFYKSPNTNVDKAVPLVLNTKGKYEGAFNIGTYDAEGEWKVNFISLMDNAENRKIIYPSDSGYKFLTNANYIVKDTIPDSTAPQITNIVIDKKEVKMGENIKITADISDDISGVKYVTIFYKSPNTNVDKAVPLVLNTKGKYEGTFNIGTNDAEGEWKVNFISLMDNAENRKLVYPYDSGYEFLTNTNYIVKDTIPDSTAPQITNIVIDKKEVKMGENIKITADISDDISGAKYVTIFYKSPNTNVDKAVPLVLNTKGKYEGTFNIGTNDAEGEWKVNFISLMDNAENRKLVYPYDSGYEFLTNANYIVKDAVSEPIQALSKICVTQNESWTSKTINGDLYIGPQAVLTINGPVTVNGNIYVLGAIKNYGDLNVTGTIYASQFNWGNSTLYNGTVLMLGGTNSISSMVASNKPVDIPFKLYEAKGDTIVGIDGKATITGATLPIIDLKLDNTKINYYYNGTFSIDLDTSNKQTINFQIVDVFGNIKTITYKISNKYYDTNKDNIIDIKDLAQVAVNYNTKKVEMNWKDTYDYNSDGIIDIYDVVMISKRIK